MNAFTIPKQSSIQLREKSAKQVRQHAERINRYEPVCTKNDFHKTQRILKGSL